MKTHLRILAWIILISMSGGNAALAEGYSDGDPCSVLGAYQLKNDANGYYGLVCDGANWTRERLIYLSGGGYGNLAFGPWSLPHSASAGDNTAFGFGGGRKKYERLPKHSCRHVVAFE